MDAQMVAELYVVAAHQCMSEVVGRRWMMLDDGG